MSGTSYRYSFSDMLHVVELVSFDREVRGANNSLRRLPRVVHILGPTDIILT